MISWVLFLHPGRSLSSSIRATVLAFVWSPRAQHAGEVCTSLVPHARGRSTYWDKAWWISRSFSTQYALFYWCLFYLQNKSEFPFLCCLFLPYQCFSFHFYVKWYGACAVFIFNCVLACVLLLKTNNSPVSYQLRNSTFHAVTEILSWTISFSNSLWLVFKCCSQQTVSFRVTFVRDAILHSLRKYGCVLTPFPVALSPALDQRGINAEMHFLKGNHWYIII